jgi:hypothetical protein
MQTLSLRNLLSGKTLVLAGVLLSAILLAGCTSSSAPDQALSPGVTNGAIIKDPAAYDGRDLILKGKIAIECSSGCWFLLDDGTGQLYVDLAKNNFAIPQLQGSTVVVKGVIRVENGDPKLYATNVTTDSRTYP